MANVDDVDSGFIEFKTFGEKKDALLDEAMQHEMNNKMMDIAVKNNLGQNLGLQLQAGASSGNK